MPQPALPETLRRLRGSSIRVAVVDVTPRDIAHAMERRGSPRLQQRLCGPMNLEPHPFS
jgi:hypothetical protein